MHSCFAVLSLYPHGAVKQLGQSVMFAIAFNAVFKARQHVHLQPMHEEERVWFEAELSCKQSTDQSSLVPLSSILTCRLIQCTVSNRADQHLPNFCPLFRSLRLQGLPAASSPSQCPPFLWTSPVAVSSPLCVLIGQTSVLEQQQKLFPFLLSLPLPACQAGAPLFASLWLWFPVCPS